MPVLSTVIAAAGLAIAAGGAAISYQASRQNAAAQQQVIAAQQQNDALRQQQMNLDAARRKREIIRSSMAARSAALAQTTAQGASGEGSSALQGAYGSIAGRTGVNYLGVEQNQQIGNAMFASNRNMFNGYSAAADAQSFGSLGSGLSSLGGAMISQAGTIGKVGTYFSTRFGGHPTNVGSAISYGR